jgi:hypothetical protein
MEANVLGVYTGPRSPNATEIDTTTAEIMLIAEITLVCLQLNGWYSMLRS